MAELAIWPAETQEVDLPAVIGLYRRVLAADGGQPFAADEWLLRPWFTDARVFTAHDGDRLVAAGSARPVSTADGPATEVVGAVDPAYRRTGVGGRLLDATLAVAAEPVVLRSECLSGGAIALYESRGFASVFAEDVMSTDLTAQPRPGGGRAMASTGTAGADRIRDRMSGTPENRGWLRFAEWTGEPPMSQRFFDVYTAAFRERPGFPGWDEATWIEWIADDDDFRAEWTLLATVLDAGTGGELDAGFIAGGAGGWITQTGVVPAARGRGICDELLTEVMRRMRNAGEVVATLNVNVNNPRAQHVYERLGFRVTGRRARFRRS